MASLQVKKTSSNARTRIGTLVAGIETVSLTAGLCACWALLTADMARAVQYSWPQLAVRALSLFELDGWNPHPWLRLPFDLASVSGRARFVAGLFAGNILAALPVLLLLWIVWRATVGREGYLRRSGTAALPATVTIALLPEAWLAVRAIRDFALGSLFGHALDRGSIPLVASIVLILGLTLLAVLAVVFGLSSLLLRRSRSRRVLPVLAVAVAVVALCLVALGPAANTIAPSDLPVPPTAELTDVVLISIDSLRADHLQFAGYGRPTSPTFDRLAREGVVLTQALAPTSWTLPSHLTLLTALPPVAHGVTSDDVRLDRGVLTLPELLRAAGYDTAAFVAGPYLEASYGFYKGFDHYDDFSVALAHGGRRSNTASHRWVSAEPVVQAVADYLAARKPLRGDTRGPLFLFIHLWEPHYDYIPPAPYDSMFDPDYDGSIDGRDFERGEQVHAGMDPRDLEHIVALYDAEIRQTDSTVASLLELLASYELFEQSILVLTADHGEEFFEHGNKGHQKELYEESLRVPLIFRSPARIPGGRALQLPVELADVPLTILGLLGVPWGRHLAITEQNLRPVDLAPLLRAEPPTADSSIAPERTLFGSLRDTLYFARGPRFKLITDLDGYRQELYDLENDPDETTNLAAGNPEMATLLASELDAWLEAVAGRFQAPSLEITPIQRERLEALGYLD